MYVSASEVCSEEMRRHRLFEELYPNLWEIAGSTRFSTPHWTGGCGSNVSSSIHRPPDIQPVGPAIISDTSTVHLIIQFNPAWFVLRHPSPICRLEQRFFPRDISPWFQPLLKVYRDQCTSLSHVRYSREAGSICSQALGNIPKPPISSLSTSCL